MQNFDLFGLHSFEEDKTVRRLLRVYSLLPKFSKETNPEKIKQAQKIVLFLRQANEKMKKKYSVSWKKEWLESTGYPFANSCAKDWLIGRASIPLIALQKLSNFGFGKKVAKLIDSCNLFCSTTGSVSIAPHLLTKELAYLSGVILGDGNIAKNKERVSLMVSKKEFAEKFSQNINFVFGCFVPVNKRKHNGKTVFVVEFDNKVAVRVFTSFFGILRGKKSDVIKVPEVIKTANHSAKMAFLEGVFDSEGCIRKGGLRLTTASKSFRDNICDILVFIGEKGYKDEWINKKYNKKYYGLQYSISNIKFLAGVR